MKLNEYVRIYDDVIDERFCKDLINIFESNPDHQDPVNRQQTPKFTQFNFTEYAMKDGAAAPKEDKQIHQRLSTTFLNMFQLYKVDLTLVDEVPARYALEQIRIKKYKKGGDEQYKEHVDVGNHNSARRFIAALLYLTDHTHEGETVFPQLNISVEPKPGRMVVFPPLWLFPHAGLPVRAEDKYIVSTYAHYL